MSIAALSPNSIIATPVQVNPQVRTDLQTTVPQVAQNSQDSARASQTDTVTISPQALKLADGTSEANGQSAEKSEGADNAEEKRLEAKDKAEEQRLQAKDKAEERQSAQDAEEKINTELRETQKIAVRAYSAASTG